MTDLWTEASRDAEAEEMARRVAAARVAAVDVWPFLAGAEDARDYANRKAVVADRLDGIVSRLLPSDPVAFGVVRASLEAALDEDYQVIAEAKSAEQATRTRVQASLEKQAKAKSEAKIAASDTGTCGVCGRATSYDKDSRKWTHDNEGPDTQHEVTKAAAKAIDAEAQVRARIEANLKRTAADVKTSATRKTSGFNVERNTGKGGWMVVYRNVSSKEEAEAKMREKERQTGYDGYLYKYRVVESTETTAVQRKVAERRVDQDPDTGEFVGSEWEPKEGDPNTLVQSDTTFGKNPRFKTEEEANGWQAETATEEPAEETPEEDPAKVEDTTKAESPTVPDQFKTKSTRKTSAEAPTYQVKKVHADTWLDGGESTEDAMEVIKANVGEYDEEFWLLRNNFNGSVGVYAYHPAMRGIDSSMPPRMMGTYEQFYGQPYREARKTSSNPSTYGEYLEWKKGQPGEPLFQDEWEEAMRFVEQQSAVLEHFRNMGSKTADRYQDGTCGTCDAAIEQVDDRWTHATSDWDDPAQGRETIYDHPATPRTGPRVGEPGWETWMSASRKSADRASRNDPNSPDYNDFDINTWRADNFGGQQGSTVIDGVTVHTFESSAQAYNESQVSDSIKDGDVLSVPSEGVVGILNQAWPIAVTDTLGEFHGLRPGTTWDQVEGGRYNHAVEVARQVAQGRTASRKTSQAAPSSVTWGQPYAGGSPAYETPDGPVWMFRKGQAVRFYDTQGNQVGPEQSNVAPAAAYAHAQGWRNPDLDFLGSRHPFVADRRQATTGRTLYQGLSMDQENDGDGPTLADLQGVIGKYVQIIFFNEHGVAADYERGRVTAVTGMADGNVEFEWQREGEDLTQPTYGWDVYRISQMEEPTDPAQMSLFSAKTASGPIRWEFDLHLGAGYLKGKAANGDNYEVYFNPNMNPTPCSWINYGPEYDGDSAPLNGERKGEGRGFATMQEAVKAAEADAAGTTASKAAATNPYSVSGNPYVAPMQTPGTPDDVLDGPPDPNPPVLDLPMTTRPRQQPNDGSARALDSRAPAAVPESKPATARRNR